MKTGFEYALGALCALFALGIFLRLLGAGLVTLGRWMEKRAYENATPEERVAMKCREISDAIRRQSR